MSKLFYDHLVTLTEIEIHIKKHVETPEEREELWRIIDEMLHHSIITALLDSLPKHHHEEFLDRFHKMPHNEEIIVFLNENIDEDVEELIKRKVENFAQEVLKELYK